MHSSSYYSNWNLTENAVLFIISVIVTVLTLLTFLYGVTSWCIKEKFRTFKNFVFLNAVFTNLLLTLLSLAVFFIQLNFGSYIYYMSVTEYISTVKFHWLIIIGYIFYDDIVKIFKEPVQNLYLKSNIFGWGISLILSAIFTYLNMYFGYYWAPVIIRIIVAFGNRFIPVVINGFLYTKVVYSLWHSFHSSANKQSICRSLCIASLIFTLINVLLSYDLILIMLIEYHRNISQILNITSALYILAVDVYFIYLSRHHITGELYNKNINSVDQKQCLNDDMQGKNTLQPTSQLSALDDVKFKNLPGV
ncbi:hypothetical protein PYW07_005121 [Mythimna separata]|uniref:Uncharacterized protein n=1 Tax=Mythimna separata TaxID=271217 RepID=A0AAD7YDT7_MYTSE|nr:hypothetical protein PYW07_005121 [Mythimna separata]